jgi:pyridoxine 5-phosphate synthase
VILPAASLRLVLDTNVLLAGLASDSSASQRVVDALRDRHWKKNELRGRAVEGKRSCNILQFGPVTKLSVNVNKVATLRNTRSIGIPSVMHAAALCLDAGAAGITVHPRPDQRHIRPGDVFELAELLKSHPGREFNIEGNPFHDYLHFAEKVRPNQCTLVPDSPEASTSDHGWDLPREARRLGPVIEQLKSFGCRVSLFMDAGSRDIPMAKKLGADRIELYTAPYAEGFAAGDKHAVDAYAKTANFAADCGLGVNAGHDLNLHNLTAFLRAVPNVLEVSIGHALIGDALEWGLAVTVGKYLAAMAESTKIV